MDRRTTKTDCFAYRAKTKGVSEHCNALDIMICNYSECNFYKTKKELCNKCSRKGEIYCKTQCKAF